MTNNIFRLEEIAFIKGGKRLPKGKKLLDKVTKYPYIRVSDFTNSGTIDLSNIKYITKEIHEEIKRYVISDKDIYISIAGTIGKTGIIPKELNGANLTENAAKIVFKEELKVNKKYFYFFTLSVSFMAQIGLATKAVAMPKLALKRLSKVKIPLPPLPEQQRIVNKLDALFARIDEAIQLVEANLELIPSLKMALLEKAFKGQLLGEVSLGKNGLPKGWIKKQVKELSSSIQYGYTGKKQEAKNYYYVRITDIQGGQINWNNVPYSDVSSKDASKYTLNQGDILFARTGATVGKSYLFNDNVDAIFASYLIRVVVNQKIIIPAFIYKFFQSYSYWRQVSNQVVGAAQPNVNGKKLGNLYITFPCIIEQDKIVNKLDSLFQNIDQLKTENQSKLKHLQDLKKSLLEQAFQGKL